MKESKLVEMKNQISAMSRVLQELINKLNNVESLAKGTLTAFQLNIGEKEWQKIVEELKDIESRPQPEEKKFEDVE
jgi:hypothetical protein|tara:strand:- start:217 stop:444 length:228 start_codon:yes stop_codon:yes gene_type:complete